MNDIVGESCDPAQATPSCNGTGQPVCFNHGFDGAVLPRLHEVTGIKPCSGSGIVDQVLNNCYRKTGNTVSFPRRGPRCGIGWKGVQAIAYWSGRFGFFECCPTAAAQRKFTTIKKTISYSTFARTEVFIPPTGINELRTTIEWQQTATVDAYGNVRRVGSKSWNEVEIYEGVEVYNVNYCNPTMHTGNYNYRVMSLLDSITVGCNGQLTGIYPGQDPYTDDPTPFVHWVWNYVSNSVVLAEPDTTTVEVTNTKLVLAASGASTDGDINMPYNRSRSSTSFRVEIELSGESLFSGVVADAKALLDLWRLNDDRVYPWRTDGKTWLQPLVTRDAYSVAPTIDWNADASCRFFSNEPYTGQILGAPQPVGYGRYFNFTHVNWTRFVRDGSSCQCCDTSLGAISPAEVPATATRWTDYEWGSTMTGPGGRISQMRDSNYCGGASGIGPLDGVKIQKWAETMEDWPGLNYARPCGYDRWVRDETTVVCVESFDGTNLVLDGSATSEFAVNDLITLATGVFVVMTKADAFNYTVGNGTTAGVVKYAYPTGISYPANDAAKLRWPDARGICGLLAVTAVQDGGNVAITVPYKHWLRAGDTVDFIGVAGLGKGLAVTVTGEKTFTVPGTLGVYSGGGYVVSAGVTTDLAKWHSTCSRRTYLSRVWESKYREAAEDPEAAAETLTQQQHDYEFSGAKVPYVLCISPNAGDTFAEGQRFDIPDILADICYGRQWVMDFVQAIADPFAQAVAEPCGHAGAWGMAALPCADDADHYPYPPLVEPRLTAPEGAPPLPVLYYTMTEAIMPAAVGAAYCSAEPRSRFTIHAIRPAWLACNDWKERVNHYCAPPVVIYADNTQITADDTNVTAAG